MEMMMIFSQAPSKRKKDLFDLSQSKKSYCRYEICVQMVKIYNDQVRDLLLKKGGTQSSLRILNSPQKSGSAHLAVPTAIICPVSSTEDVLKLMQRGLKSRATGATTWNERSSRHSVLMIHVDGKDLETNAEWHASLNLVDLAASERASADKSKERQNEANHINQSLLTLKNVIRGLALKKRHVPYRDSKLTELLQSLLGGKAKTLMLLQLKDGVESLNETIQTLKFAECAAGVELGPAHSNKAASISNLCVRLKTDSISNRSPTPSSIDRVPSPSPSPIVRLKRDCKSARFLAHRLVDLPSFHIQEQKDLHNLNMVQGPRVFICLSNSSNRYLLLEDL